MRDDHIGDVALDSAMRTLGLGSAATLPGAMFLLVDAMSNPPPPLGQQAPTWGVAAVLVAAALLVVLLLPACSAEPGAAARGPSHEAERRAERDQMVDAQLAARGIHDARVLLAMRQVPRHEFVPTDRQPQAYDDRPLPIGHAQTISQPFIVAFMTEALELRGGEKVLEIGTGSGYQAAVLAALGCRVHSIEIVAPLAERAAATLQRLGYDVQLRTGDGYRGWPEAAPFDCILVTAAPEHVPQPLLDQLAVGGRLILPVGDLWQEIVMLHKTADGVHRRELLPVRFVPMTGEAERGR